MRSLIALYKWLIGNLLGLYKWLIGNLLGLYKWMTCRPSYMFLTAGDERLAAQKPARFTFAWLELMGLSVLTGLMLIGVWTVTWWIFNDWDRLSRPAAATAIVLLVWPLRMALVAIGPALRFRDRANQTAVATAAAALVGVAVMSLTDRYPSYGVEYAMPGWIAWIRPALSIHRVLLIMPIWGAWSMLIAVQFQRPGTQTDPITRRFAQACGPLSAVACMSLPLVGTILYFHYMDAPGQMVVTSVTVAVAILTGPILCKISGGLTRQALLASNMITQIVFLMICTVWL